MVFCRLVWLSLQGWEIKSEKKWTQCAGKLFSHLTNLEMCLKVVLLTWNFGSKPNGFYGNPIFSFWLTKIPEKDQQDQWFDKTFTFSNPLSSSTRPKTVRAHLLAANSPCTSRLKMKVCESLKFCWENPLSRLLRPGTYHPLSSCCLQNDLRQGRPPLTVGQL